MVVLTQKAKKEIVGTRYDYFSYTKKSIKEIAEKDVHDLGWIEGATLVQAIFPNHLICSGLFEKFLAFECHDGKRVDPPKYSYSNLDHPVILKKILKLFQDNDIKYHKSWDDLKTIVEERENAKKKKETKTK